MKRLSSLPWWPAAALAALFAASYLGGPEGHYITTAVVIAALGAAARKSIAP